MPKKTLSEKSTDERNWLRRTTCKNQVPISYEFFVQIYNISLHQMSLMNCRPQNLFSSEFLYRFVIYRYIRCLSWIADLKTFCKERFSSFATDLHFRIASTFNSRSTGAQTGKARGYSPSLADNQLHSLIILSSKNVCLSGYDFPHFHFHRNQTR